MRKRDVATGRPYNDTPLTEEQKARASNPKTVMIPHAMAKRHCNGYRENYERIYGFAVWAYMNCARSFKVEMSPEGEKGWPGYAAHWTERNMLTANARYLAKEIPRVSLDAPLSDDGSTIAQTIADSGSDPTVAPENYEEYHKLLGRLKGLKRGAVYLVVCKRMTHLEAGELLAISREYVKQLVDEAIRELQFYCNSAHPGADNSNFLRAWWTKATPKLKAKVEAKRIKGIRKAWRVKQLTKLAMGGVAAFGYYIAHPDKRLVVGPYPSEEVALSILPYVQRPDGNTSRQALQRFRRRHGLPYQIRHSEARIYVKNGWTATPIEKHDSIKLE